MPGFDFSNHTRNAALHARGVPLPKATSTGTTIVGCIFDGGVVVCLLLRYITMPLTPAHNLAFRLDMILTTLIQIAADTRATSGPIVADKVSHTIFYV
jgi:20S proteasome subunit beta 2